MDRLYRLIAVLAFTAHVCYAQAPPQDTVEANPDGSATLALTFNEGPGAKDWADKNTITDNTATWAITGGDGVYDCEGTGRICVPHNAAFDFDGENTLAIWCRTEPLTGNISRRLFSKRVIAGGNPGVFADLIRSGSGNAGKLEYTRDQGATVLQLTETGFSTRYDDGEWHLFVITVSGGTAQLYIDGEPEGSGSTAGSTANTVTLYIGSQQTGTANFWEDDISAFLLWDRALTKAEIRDMWQAGKAGQR